MNIYLSQALARNRKGRFLQTVIGAIPLAAEWPHLMPAGGLLLVQAEELTHSDALLALYQWAMQVGCAVLVIDPLSGNLALLAKLPTPLDWGLAPAHMKANEPGVALILAGETDQALIGFAGSADRQQHIAGDTVHTRYIRKHSNSGVFAVTTLPLWSLNLLDHAEVLKSWLHWFVEHAGQATLTTEKQPELAVYSPDKYDMVVMLLLYAGNGKSLNKLVDSDSVKQVFDVNSLDIKKRCEVLQEHGFINAAGLTDAGKASLQASQYWAYAPLLIQQLSTGAL